MSAESERILQPLISGQDWVTGNNKPLASTQAKMCVTFIDRSLFSSSSIVLFDNNIDPAHELRGPFNRGSLGISHSFDLASPIAPFTDDILCVVGLLASEDLFFMFGMPNLLV